MKPSAVIAALGRHALERPEAIALESPTRTIRYRELDDTVAELAAFLRGQSARRVALLADNGPEWAVVDLATLAAGTCCVPLPLFFSAQQVLHALATSGADWLLVDAAATLPPLPEPALDLSHRLPRSLAGRLRAIRLAAPESALPVGTAKITYTSGTTGQPKGVCLDAGAQDAVAAALAAAAGATTSSRHLSVLPLATLLENLGGLYAPLLAGATAIVPGLADVGLRGSSELDVAALVARIQATAPSTLILVPQMLLALVTALERDNRRLDSLQFVAVGGAPVSALLLERARRCGIPVYEGYGLSECASVVALNRPGDERAGSVGRPLPHVKLHFALDGEILVESDSVSLGYLGQAGDPGSLSGNLIATGDIGHVDADGFLYLSGRKKNLFVTAFGRNVAPEWIESELVLQPPILQAAVFGEGKPWNVAVIVSPRSASDDEIASAVAHANWQLPDYARIRRWLRASEAFTAANGQATANGRWRRPHLLATYASRIDRLYEE